VASAGKARARTAEELFKVQLGVRTSGNVGRLTSKGPTNSPLVATKIQQFSGFGGRSGWSAGEESEVRGAKCCKCTACCPCAEWGAANCLAESERLTAAPKDDKGEWAAAQTAAPKNATATHKDKTPLGQPLFIHLLLGATLLPSMWFGQCLDCW